MFRDTANGNDNLIFYNGHADSNTYAHFDLFDTHIPSGSTVTKSDDVDGGGNSHSHDELSLNYEPEGDWGWGSCCTDGGVLELGSGWEKIRMNPNVDSGVGPNLFLNANNLDSDISDTGVITIYSNVPPEKPNNPSPNDGSTTSTTDVTLEVDVSDVEGDSMDVGFYNPDDQSTVLSDSYSSGFSGWSSNPTYSCGSKDMMGGYGNFGSGASTQKTINNLDAGRYKVTFNFYHIDSWDGENGRFFWNGNQKWSRSHRHDNDKTDVCGASWPESLGIAYDKASFYVDHSGGDATLKFDSTLNQGSTDESWGVNNIQVKKMGIIGEDTNVANGGTASVQWNNLNSGQTYNWYAEACDSSMCTESNTWSFTADPNTPPNKPDQPNPADYEIVRNSDISISARYTDPEGQDGALRFYNASDGVQIGSCSVTDGNRCTVTWNNIDHGQNDWYAVAEDSSGGTNTSDTWSVIYNRKPQLVSPPDNPSDGQKFVEGREADLRVTVDDPDGDSVDVIFYNNKTGATLNTKTDTDGSGQLTHLWDNLNDGTQYWWHVQASDSWESVQSDNWTFTTNALPEAGSPVPPDGGVAQNKDVELKVDVSDDDSVDDPLKVYFFDDSDNTLIGKETVSNGGTASVTWDGREIGRQYSWFVNVSDTRENGTWGSWTFTRSSSASYRAETEILYKYSTIIAGIGSPVFVRFKVINDIGVEKNLSINLDGGPYADAEFASGGAQRNVVIEPYSERRFEIRINPVSAGSGDLRIETKNREVGTVNVNTIPLLVKEYGARNSDLPGIGLVQLIFAVSAATLLFYSSL